MVARIAAVLVAVVFFGGLLSLQQATASPGGEKVGGEKVSGKGVWTLFGELSLDKTPRWGDQNVQTRLVGFITP